MADVLKTKVNMAFTSFVAPKKCGDCPFVRVGCELSKCGHPDGGFLTTFSTIHRECPLNILTFTVDFEPKSER